MSLEATEVKFIHDISKYKNQQETINLHYIRESQRDQGVLKLDLQ